MKNYKTINLIREDEVLNIVFNRPEIHNAFDDIMIEELIDAIEIAEAGDSRLLTFKGGGESFCAGADLNWMKKMAGYDFNANLEDSRKLSKLIDKIYSFSKPTIALVHGAVIGGGNGIVASCDLVIAEEKSFFVLSEVKIGLVPAVISPYIIKRIGEFNARYLMLSGKKIDAFEAQKMGLVNIVAGQDEIEKVYKENVELFLRSAPGAVQICKKLIRDVVNSYAYEEASELTAKIIAEVRVSPEGQEGMSSFLEKRKPSWRKNK
ncbi:enoyl-CoA hydratase/isomerase family protein [Melioribacter roseus P3M-2]|uniref:Enoyl-CoA hydratase/isomerase family protein n=1 Tax=Melioribacter roseus (strain DSM 23840 / JCM 17771 / VKM B-2668 / P3M-2) TaxID=1191523 RepID=I7A455_MELRP|nr:enoyl-CoA hydratase-related protein [Melioribacter roseus]AFN75973.1 enoyl-CoA hydratase/isomerase family protein [Melioribacter roseus P3M-2]